MSFRTCFGSQGLSCWPSSSPPESWRERFDLIFPAMEKHVFYPPAMEGSWFHLNDLKEKVTVVRMKAPLSAKPCVMRRKK